MAQRNKRVCEERRRTKSTTHTGSGASPWGRRGASGFVQLAVDTETDEQVAIKFIERGGRTSQRIIARELLNHRECAMHPHIVQLKVRPGPPARPARSLSGTHQNVGDPMTCQTGI